MQLLHVHACRARGECLGMLSVGSSNKSTHAQYVTNLISELASMQWSSSQVNSNAMGKLDWY